MNYNKILYCRSNVLFFFTHGFCYLHTSRVIHSREKRHTSYSQYVRLVQQSCKTLQLFGIRLYICFVDDVFVSVEANNQNRKILHTKLVHMVHIRLQ
jgi:hypothetical protein